MPEPTAKTRVVNLRTEDFDAYIGRAVNRAKDPRCHKASIWANPFKPTSSMAPAQAIARYREHITRLLDERPELRAELMKLKGKRLGCWCKPGPCHGDVLVELIEKSPRRRP